MIFLSQNGRLRGLNKLSGATLVVVLLLSGCASQPQSITGETPTPALQQELRRLEITKKDGQQLADYLRIAQITSQRLDETPPAMDQATTDLPITLYDRAVTDFVVSWSDQGRPEVIHDTRNGRNTRLLVSHSSDTTWSPAYAVFHARATELLPLVNSRPLLRDALLFRAYPLVKRIIFISTPHRGSAIASGGIGALGSRLIRLPAIITSSVPRQIARLANARGMRIPTSIDGLSPKSPLFKVYDGVAIRSPHHSIIGDRGRGDTPHSSDGVAPYWSSHLDTARSELIVPTGHGAMNSPLAIAEIQRILRLNAGVAHPSTKSGRGLPIRQAANPSSFEGLPAAGR